MSAFELLPHPRPAQSPPKRPVPPPGPKVQRRAVLEEIGVFEAELLPTLGIREYPGSGRKVPSFLRVCAGTVWNLMVLDLQKQNPKSTQPPPRASRLRGPLKCPPPLERFGSACVCMLSRSGYVSMAGAHSLAPNMAYQNCSTSLYAQPRYRALKTERNKTMRLRKRALLPGIARAECSSVHSDPLCHEECMVM